MYLKMSNVIVIHKLAELSFFTPPCSEMTVRNGQHEQRQDRDCNGEAENVEGKTGDLA